MKYIKSAARLLNINCVNKGGLDLSKEVLQISVEQRTLILQAFEVGGKKNSSDRPGVGEAGLNQADRQNFFLPPTLTACKTAAL